MPVPLAKRPFSHPILFIGKFINSCFVINKYKNVIPVQSSADVSPGVVEERPDGQLLHFLSESTPVAEEYVFAGQSEHCETFVAPVEL